MIHSLRRLVLGTAVVLALAASDLAQAQTHYVRYEAAGRVSWGILEGETIRELQGSIFDGAAKPSGRTLKLAEVKLLPPAEARKVIAAGFNYKSHIGEQSPAKYVGLFAKFPTSLVGHNADIIHPADATNVHYEAELCVAADTFGPIGPAVVANVDYNKLKLIGRHNGDVVQETTTDLLIFSIDHIVSYTSRYITLEPGDVIFTGTPGTTRAMKPGDTFEVEIPGVGTLKNTVVAEKK